VDQGKIMNMLTNANKDLLYSILLYMNAVSTGSENKNWLD